MLDDDIVEAAKRLLDICKRKNLTVATAESCTAGLVAGTLTEIPGISSILDRGFITYSNQAKQDMLGVSAATLQAHGAVSRETAEEMARGALAHAPVDLAVSVTGIAGPGWRHRRKAGRARAFRRRCALGPVRPCRETIRRYRPREVRKQSVLQAFRMLHDLAEARSRRARHATDRIG